MISTRVKAKDRSGGNGRASVQLLPHDEWLEGQVLGMMLVSPEVIGRVIEFLGETAERFYSTRNRAIYSSIVRVHSQGVRVDVVSIVSDLRRAGCLYLTQDDATNPRKVSVPSLAELSGNATVFLMSDVESACRGILNMWVRRKGIIQCQQTQSLLLDDQQDHLPILTSLSGDFGHLVGLAEERSVTGDKQVYLPDEILHRRKAGMRARARVSPVSTGYKLLDRKLSNPLAPGELTIIAGRPSVGKSALKANLIVRLCEAGYGVLSVTPEQGFDREMDRIDSIYTGVPLRDLLRVADWPEGDPRVGMVTKANETYSREWELYVMSRRGTRFSDVGEFLNRLEVAGKRVDVVFIDLFDRMKEITLARPSDRPAVIQNQLILATEIAQRYGNHFCMLAQISRGGAEGRPTMDWIKGSGGYEEVADTVLLLHRPDPRTLDVIIGKQRNGEGGDAVFVRMPFYGANIRIDDVSVSTTSMGLDSGGGQSVSGASSKRPGSGSGLPKTQRSGPLRR